MGSSTPIRPIHRAEEPALAEPGDPVMIVVGGGAIALDTAQELCALQGHRVVVLWHRDPDFTRAVEDIGAVHIAGALTRHTKSQLRFEPARLQFDDAILLALTDAQRRHAIPAGLLDELAIGTAMDVEESEVAAQSSTTPGLSVQYKTFDDLRVYCYRVASVVGLVCIHIFGYRDPAAEELAEHCGLAFQMTNINDRMTGLGRLFASAG